MKVRFNQNINYMEGKADQQVFMKSPSRTYSIVRRYRYPTITDNNHERGLEMQNLAVAYAAVSPTYAQDLATYNTARNAGPKTEHEMEQIANNKFAWFVKMMYAWLKSDPEHVNLTAVTVADIVALDAEVRTIKRAVEAGFLPECDGYTALTAGIQ